LEHRRDFSHIDGAPSMQKTHCFNGRGDKIREMVTPMPRQFSCLSGVCPGGALNSVASASQPARKYLDFAPNRCGSVTHTLPRNLLVIRWSAVRSVLRRACTLCAIWKAARTQTGVNDAAPTLSAESVLEILPPRGVVRTRQQATPGQRTKPLAVGVASIRRRGLADR